MYVQRLMPSATLLVAGCVGEIVGGGGGRGGDPAPGGSPRSDTARGSISPGESGGQTGGSSARPAACAPGPAAPPARLRRLTRLDLQHTLADLAGVAPTVVDIEDDAPALGFSTGDGRAVSAAYADSLRRIADIAAAEVRRTAPFPASCLANEPAGRACAEKFTRDFGKLAYRRPLTGGEVASLLAVYDAGRETGAPGNSAGRFGAGIEWVARALLQSPSFIYLTETGAPAAAGSATRVTPYELASAVAYLVTASPPDAALLAAADAGTLQAPEDVAAHVRRLARAHPDRFKAQVRRFATEWLAIDFHEPAWNKKTSIYPLFSEALKEAFRQETALYLDDWATTDPTLPRLLTSHESFVNRWSAAVYGRRDVTAAMSQRTALDPRERAGLLTQGSFLGTHAHVDASAPILRGLAIARSFFCRVPPNPPPDVAPLPPVAPRETRTTRARVANHIEAGGPACKGCHDTFNPMGYAFEAYDGIGAYRTQENGVPVDGSGAIVGTPRSDRIVTGAVDLAAALARSPDVHECFARQVFRYGLGRGEGAFDECSLEGAARTFAAKNLDFVELLAAIAASDSFSMRTSPKEGPP